MDIRKSLTVSLRQLAIFDHIEVEPRRVVISISELKNKINRLTYGEIRLIAEEEKAPTKDIFLDVEDLINQLESQ